MAVEAARAEVQRLDALLSAANPASEVSRLNQTGGRAVSPDTAALLRLSLETCKGTWGLFDCTVYPLMGLWVFPTQDYRVPSAKEMAAILPLVDSAKLRFDEEERTLRMELGQAVDFGGVGKDCAAARVMEIFRDHGARSGTVSLGAVCRSWAGNRINPPGASVCGTRRGKVISLCCPWRTRRR